LLVERRHSEDRKDAENAVDDVMSFEFGFDPVEAAEDFLEAVGLSNAAHTFRWQFIATDFLFFAMDYWKNSLCVSNYLCSLKVFFYKSTSKSALGSLKKRLFFELSDCRRLNRMNFLCIIMKL
jgi:hypothetical protein